jgi:uncharacterized protein
MSEHPNVQRLRDAYTAFGKGDFDVLTQLWADDIRWHEPGSTELSGEYTGPQQVFAMFGRLMEITEGSFRLDVRTVLADDNWGTAVVHLTAHRGERTLDTVSAHIMRIRDGRVAEFWEASTDQAALDAFFG